MSKRIAGSTLPASTANRGVDAMSVLSKLEIVALPPKSGLTPEQQRRAKVIVKLQEQLKLAEAALGGPAYKRQRWK